MKLIKYYFQALLLVLLFLSFNTIQVFSQGTSNKGTDFWLLYAPHINGFTDMKQKMSIYITSDVNTSGKIEIPGVNFTTSFNVEVNKVTIVDIPQVAYVGGVEGLVKKGIHLTSQKPIVAYGHIYNSAMSGATLLLPTNTLGKDYYSINFTQRANSDYAYSFTAVVATEDNTQVVITPTVDTQGGLKAGIAKTIVLNKGEIYQVFAKQTSVIKDKNGNITTSFGDDLTGTTIKSIAANGQSCKKIAVFSGSSRISIGCLSNSGLAGSADNLFQQVYPTATWGKTFITTPSKDRNFDVFRVFKSSANAIVKINGTPINQSSFVNNLYYEFESKDVNYIEGDNNIQVVQYQVTQGKGINCSTASGDVGDPEMIFLNPLEQTLNKMTMYSSPFYKILKHYINIVIQTADISNFKLDGTSNPAWFKSVAGKPGYSYAQIQVAEGTHVLESVGGFNAIAYGFGTNESYGYAAGASLISPGIEAVNNVTQLKMESGCINDPYNLFISLPYEPLSLKANFDDGQGEISVPIVKVDTYSLNNITYYKYRLIENKIYQNPKIYNIKVWSEKPVSDGCGAIDELELDYEVLTQAIPNFEVQKDKYCKGQAVSFKDKSDPTGNNIVKWHWDFGDGNKIVKTNADEFTHSFSPGTYTVKLKVENQSGCISPTEFSKVVQVLNEPVIDFKTVGTVCETKKVQFQDLSTSADDTIEKWHWDFGDEKSSSDKNPNHIFDVAGNYTVKLTLTTSNGCQVELTKTVKVNDLPKVDFELPDFCLNDSKAKFINKSTIKSNETLYYTWDFGDANSTSQNPNTSNAKDAEHSYSKTGLYDITLTVKSINGCEVVVKKQFRVNGSIPNAGFEVVNSNKLCSGSEILFKDNATVDFGEITRIEWIFDAIHKSTPDIVDEQPNLRSQEAKVYKHIYASFTDEIERDYVVKMRVFSGASCVNEVTKLIKIYPLPKVDFQSLNECLPNGLASFKNLTTFIDNSVTLTYLWDFGDHNATAQNPNTSTSVNATHHYTEAGKYNVKLIAKSPYGCETIASKEIVIKGAIPIANFSVENQDALCVAQPVKFVDNSTLAFGEITRIEWYFDYIGQPNQVVVDDAPGTRSSSKTYSFQYPVFNFPATKDYVVKMVAYSGADCLASIERTIVLKALPQIEFNAIGEYCLYAPDLQLHAKELNNLPGQGVFVGPGVTAEGVFNPARAGVGEHTITYKFTVAGGCEIQKSQKIIVNEVPVVDAGEDLKVLEGGQVIINASAYGQNLTYKWTPAIGLDRDDVLKPIVKPEIDVLYTLTVTTDKGCVSKDDVFVKVLYNLEVPNSFTPNGDGLNDVWNINYIQDYPNVKVEVFDRNGQRVFYSLGYPKPFDGTFNGKELPIGTYYYVITLPTKKKPLTNSLTIIR